MRLLLIPLLALSVAACDDDDPGEPVIEDDIVEIAGTTPSLSTLVAALQAADLVGALQGTGPFTVFAPVNDAFDDLPAGELDRLLDPANEAELQEILQYHVVAGEFEAGDLQEGQTLTTLAGEDITITLSGGAAVNGASILETDIEASNGVVHLIGAVLLPPRPTITGTAAATADLSTLVTALTAAGLEDDLDGAGPFTVFAPVNSAFDALGADVVATLLEAGNIDFLTEILGFHVIPGAAVYAGELTDGQTATTLQGTDLTFGVNGDAVTVNGVDVVARNIRASNGVVHLIDEVLVPPVDIVEQAILTAQTQVLVDAVVAADLVPTLKGDGPFTVFAPVNAAFEALGTDRLDVLLAPENQELLQKVLTYHVIPGDIRAADLTDGAEVGTVEGSTVTIDLSGAAPMVNGAEIIATDIVTENGVIHLIDGVLTENLDLVDVATVNGFSTLVSLVAQQGLATTLRGDNGGAGYTVFAPTNAAFDALAAVPSGDALTQVLLYHVVGATVESGDLSDGQVVTTLQGGTFTVNTDGGVTITDGAGNTVNVTMTDVPASNGVIHVLDAVLLPSG